jgi:SAM-dependent methyltransferase
MGVDIDQDALAVAKSRLRIETTWMDLSRVPFPFEDASFTVVVAGELLEHLPLSANVVQEVLRVLTPGGLFVGSVPNAFHWRARLAFLRGRSNEDPTHLSLFSLSSLRSLLEGFPQVQVLPVGGIGGRALPVLPDWLSGPLVRGWPQMLANDFVFRAEAPGFPKAVNG